MTADVSSWASTVGLSDSFYDEDSKCKVPSKGETRLADQRLESLMESWHKGDFFQYTKWEPIPEDDRRRKYGNKPRTTSLRRTKEHLNKDPLILNGKVPVHASCSNCDKWLEAYAKITNGKFDRIIEPEATREEKELVILPRTAKKLREEFDSRLAHLQESCNHEKSKWTIIERTRGYGNQQTLVCLRCDKILETKNPKLGTMRGRLKQP